MPFSRLPQSTLARLPFIRISQPVPLRLRLPFWIASLCALASAAVYALTFADINVHPILFLLPLLFLVWFLVLQQWRRVPRRNFRSEIFGDIPRWMKAAAAALILFAFVNFFVCLALNDYARPQRTADGRTLLQARERVVRELTTAEFAQAQTVQLRMLSGFFVGCFALAALLAETCWIKNGPAMANAKI